MDIATLTIVHAVLEERGIRKAARRTGRPVTSVSAALKRLEAAISVPLVRSEGGNLVPTLEARRRFEDFAAVSLAAKALTNVAGQPAPKATVPSIGLTILQRFVACARNGSIRSTAKQLGLGQPQLTRQLADLERALGFPLLLRSASGITCTPEGLAAIPIAEDLIDIWSRLSQSSGDRFRRAAATWRLGSVMPLGPESEIAHMLAALTAEWHRTRPRQPLFVSSTTADELIAGLKSRRFDAVLLDLADFPGDFEGRLISQTALALAGSHAIFAECGGNVRRLLMSNPMAVPSLKSGLRQQAARFLERTLSEAERNRMTMVEVDSIPVIINMVMNHGYLSVLPESSIARIQSPPAMVRLEANYVQSLSLVWQKNALSRQVGEAMLGMIRARGN
ncbi:LysR family transcriptional regulator [Rhizobium sp. 32-5/1]|uniref:LysR family transcriptional regulator n=1 Tax=Rhizobium sp. 32-5/1 TaxID=3019602 RepID=UPI00240D2513|nr:LysR family transcriptional regulator [Rhizobium sp. 32-5/1]WEZ83040.1 LysR family transcriptional regulator [Rhizobium sp. 32-5/1]